jgi:hypothetical protein
MWTLVVATLENEGGLVNRISFIILLFSAISIGQNPPTVTTGTSKAHHPRWRKHKTVTTVPAVSGTTGFSVDECSPSDHFELICALPYTARPRQIDQSCGHCGDAEQSSMSPDKVLAEEWQNFQKTNFCASGQPTQITTADFKELQTLVDAIPDFQYGNPHAGGSGPPLDRSKLQNLPALSSGKTLHEGDLVTYVGYLAEEHYSPSSASSTGESVNCHFTDQPNVDIHIALSETQIRVDTHAKASVKDPILCETVSAELIPHYRPENWEFAQLEQVSDRQVKLTGQLFFDGSHHPCGPHHSRSDPSRAASWEIHPVYDIQVCRNSSGSCDPTRDSDWKSMDSALQEFGSTIEEQ